MSDRREWRPASLSVLCEKHFKEDLIIRVKGPGQRSRLKWTCNPIPTIHSEKALRRPSVLPTKCPQLRNSPKIRHVQPDQLQEFLKSDAIHDFNDIDVAKHWPAGFQYKKNEISILFYRTVFDNETELPVISECIKLDHNNHVKLQHNGKYVSLSKWFLHGRSAKLTRFSMLHYLSNHLANEAEKH